VVRAEDAVERALVVVAHPDDVDFWAGGTVACWTSAGTTVTYCVLSDGDSGGFDPHIPRSAIPQIRRTEQEAAAAVLGVSDVRFLGYPDGCIEPSYALRRDISRLIRQVRPARVLTWSPEWSWRRFHRNHPDHRAAGEATLSAVFPDARNPFAHPELLNDEGLEPWEVGEVWLMGARVRTTMWISPMCSTASLPRSGPMRARPHTGTGWKRKCVSGSPPTARWPACRQTVSPRPFRWSPSPSVMAGARAG
jgi:LmbE family N-acetylglucosaminyl deacetylase